MIERYIHQPRTLRRLQDNPLGTGLENLAVYLAERGYTPGTISVYVRTAAHFGRWLEQERVEPDSITEDTVSLFLHEHLPRCTCAYAIRSLKDARPVLRHLLTALRDEGRIPVRLLPDLTPVDQEIKRFEEHLRTVCDCAHETIVYRTRYVRDFLKTTYDQRPLRPKDLAPRDIISFIRQRARDCKPQSTRLIASSLRSYLRFLCLHGEIDRDLSIAVPAVAGWRQAHLPRTLSEGQIERFFSTFNLSTPTGRRDYAICLCLSELGLRAHEVAGLCLDALHWREGTVRVSRTKTRRSRLLPLPSRVGGAIADYLRNGRPKSADRHVFLRHVAPRGLGIGVQIVRNAVDRACSRLELRFGPHIFRHAFASRLYEKGTPFKEIADLLGHQAIDTVSIYAKVNLAELSKVALPWPGVRS